MNRQIPIIIAFGLSSAVLYAAALSGIAVGLFITYLAQLPLFIVGLWLGTRAAAIAGGGAVVALAVIGGAMPALLYALSTALPVSILVMMALRKREWTDGKEYWYPPGNLLRGTALWCGFLLVAAAIILGLFGDGFEAAVAKFVGHIIEMVEQGTGSMAAPGLLNQMTVILPGITAWSWMLMATVNGLLAQMLVQRFGKNLRPGFVMAEIDIPLPWAGLLLGAMVLAFLLPGDLGFTMKSMALVLAFPMFFQGLSVVHAAMASFKVRSIGYVAFYVLMIFFGWLALAVVALGSVEPVLKLRERLMRPKNT